jgi:hypothetical protein
VRIGAKPCVSSDHRISLTYFEYDLSMYSSKQAESADFINVSLPTEPRSVAQADGNSTPLFSEFVEETISSVDRALDSSRSHGARGEPEDRAE